MWFADHPMLLPRSRQQIVRLDHAIADENELRTALEARLNAKVTAMTVQQLDLVNDTTLVDVRFQVSDVPAQEVSLPTASRSAALSS